MATITMRGFRKILDFQIKMFKEALETGDPTAQRISQHSILAMGPAGIGKSEVVMKAAKDNGFELIDVRLPQMSEVEIAGLIYPSNDKSETVWLRPDFLPEEGCKNTILFLDEITAATKRVQVAAYQLVLDRRIGAHKLPDNVLIVAAGNREDDHGVYVEMAAPLANRFEIHEIVCDSVIWLEDYARDNVNAAVCSFIQENPDKLHTQAMMDESDMAFATPRSWKRVSDVMDSLAGKNDKLLRTKIYGNIGPLIGSEFMEWSKSHSDLVIIDDIFAGKEVAIPTAEDKLIYVVNAVLDKFNDKVKDLSSMTPELEKTIINVYNFAEKLRPELFSTITRGMKDSNRALEEAILLIYFDKMDIAGTSNVVELYKSQLGDEDAVAESEEPEEPLLDEEPTLEEDDEDTSDNAAAQKLSIF